MVDDGDIEDEPKTPLHVNAKKTYQKRSAKGSKPQNPRKKIQNRYNNQ